jgi:multisubunit Na+/H+ antiporter MnhF subunit
MSGARHAAFVSVADGAPLLHPLALGSIALLVVNDHLLKARWPGLVTGKLSDVAGMIFFPLLVFVFVAVLARVVRRPAMASRGALVGCALATAVVFALVKTWAPATAAFEIALGALRWPLSGARALFDGATSPPVSRAAVVRDATDLVAIPFVALACAIGWRYARPATRASRS